MTTVRSRRMTVMPPYTPLPWRPPLCTALIVLLPMQTKTPPARPMLAGLFREIIARLFEAARRQHGRIPLRPTSPRP